MTVKDKFKIPESVELQFRTLLLEKYGQSLDDHIFQTFLCTMQERMKKLRIKSPHEYYIYLADSNKSIDEQNEILDKITVGETYFFRNKPQFDALENKILPQLIQSRVLSNNMQIRIWSAGCSSGDEPYSIAIILRELIPNIEDWDISILATDINRISLAKAKRGTFSQKNVKNIPKKYLEKYFQKSKEQFHIDHKIKEMVIFRRFNLIDIEKTLPEMDELDIIFCRNVTIYFNISYTRKLIKKFHSLLKNEGTMFLGHSETLYNISEDFAPFEYNNTFVYKKTPKGKIVECTKVKPSKPKPRPQAKKLSIEELITKLSITSNNTQKISVPSKPSPLKNKNVTAPDNIIKPKNSSNFSEQFSNAVKLANKEKFAEAIDILKELLKDNLLHTETYYLLGILSIKTKNYKQAEKYLRQVLYNEPTSAMAYFNLAELYSKEGKLVNSTREYNNAVKILETLPPETQLIFSEDYSAGFLLQVCKKKLLKLKSN